MSLKQRIFNIVASPFAWFFKSANAINVRLAEWVAPVFRMSIGDKHIRFACSNRLTLWRAQTLLTKEPDTIRWIDGFNAGDVLYDIGANVGTYSIYAGIRGVRVFAFEPEAQNFALLNRNIYLNKLQETVSGYNLALGSSHRIGDLYLSGDIAGGALNNFGEATDFNHKPFVARFKQGVLCLTLDELVDRYNLPAPTHVKIDVDGLEREIVDGAKGLLRNPQLKSVLIELNSKLPAHTALIGILAEIGFRVENKQSTTTEANSPFGDQHNYIFARSHDQH